MTVSDSKATRSKTPRRKAKADTTSPASAPRLTRVGVKEFRDKATQLLAQDTPFAVERHGKVIGFYTPLAAKNPAAAQEAVGHYDQTMQNVARQLQMTRTELDELLWGEDA